MKGFLGPLEDVSITIPIVVGLVLFISSVTFTFDKFYKQNNRIDAYKGALEIAYTALESGKIDMKGDLDTLCTKLDEIASQNYVKYQMLVKIDNYDSYCDEYDIGYCEVVCEKNPGEGRIYQALEFPAAIRPSDYDEEKYWPGWVEIRVWK